MNKPRIKLHPVHGVNSTQVLCFWCGGVAGEAMLGASYSEKAPPRMFINYDPCEACVAAFDGRIHLIVTLDEPAIEKQPPLPMNGKPRYPDGRFLLMTERLLKEMVTDSDVLKVMLENRVAVITPEIYALMGGKRLRKEELEYMEVKGHA